MSSDFELDPLLLEDDDLLRDDEDEDPRELELLLPLLPRSLRGLLAFEEEERSRDDEELDRELPESLRWLLLLLDEDDGRVRDDDDDEVARCREELDEATALRLSGRLLELVLLLLGRLRLVEVFDVLLTTVREPLRSREAEDEEDGLVDDGRLLAVSRDREDDDCVEELGRDDVREAVILERLRSSSLELLCPRGFVG